MSKFPADRDLLAFFAVEPKECDPGLPWHYNRLEFEVVRDAETIVCIVHQAEGLLSLRWSLGERELVAATFDGIVTAFLRETPVETLVMQTEEGNPLEICLSLYPRIQLELRQGTPV